MSLQVSVDRDVCMGSGNCVYWAPGAFELGDDDIATVLDPGAVDEEKLLQAMRNCPTKAISLRRDGEPRHMSATVVPLDPEGRGGPRSRKGAKTRARLLEAGKEVFEEQGYIDTRIADITARAGLSHGAFYHYFDSKEQIFREIAEQLDDLLAEPMESVILARDSDFTPHARLLTALRRHFESYREEAAMMGVIEQVARYAEEVAEVRYAQIAHHREQMAHSIAHLQRHGQADPSIDPVIAAAALGAMTERFAEMWLVQGFLDCDLDAAAETLASLIVNALRAG